MGRRPIAQGSFADLEFRAQGVAREPPLRAIADFLDAHGDLVELVHRDLVRGLRQPALGRPGLTALQVLRAFVLQRVKDWELRERRARIADGYTLRRFTGFDSQRVPGHAAFHRAFTRLTPATVRALTDAVVQAAVTGGLEDGTKLRGDTTVVATDIHFPTDSTLLWDAGRVLTRRVGRVAEHPPAAAAGFPDRTRRARRRMQEISRLAPRARARQQRRTYQDLLAVTAEVVAAARTVVAQAPAAADALTVALVAGRCAEIDPGCALADRVLAQTRRRVLQGEEVPVGEKLFSLFEPHTDLIVRGKARRPVEFGHKVFLAESGRGLITEYRVLDGHPADEAQVPPSLAHHLRTFGRPPALYAGDRGFASPANGETLTAAGVALVCLPQRGGAKTPERRAHEQSRAFKRGQRFRAGIEGRISVLCRGRGMKRCRPEGRDRFEVFVGLAVLANNLLRIAELTQKPQGRRRLAA